MRCFSWLHLTDLHQGMQEQGWLWPGVREIFFEDLERLHKRCGPWDLVLFTGDLTQRGSAEEFQKIDDLLGQLWTHFNTLGFSPKLLAVPGNHDLVRPDPGAPAVLLLREWSNRPKIQDEFWEDAESPYRQVAIQVFANYDAWWKRQPFQIDSLNPGLLPGDFSATLEKDGAKLGIIGLNTSFLQLTGDDYEGRLALHTRQFHAACSGDGPTWAKQHHACLLLTHHPPAWLSLDSRQHLKSEITSHGRFAVHLCGHLHEAEYKYIAEGGTEARRTWQGRSLFGLEYFGEEDQFQRLHGYTAGKIELSQDAGQLYFWPREARLQGGQRRMVPDFSVELTDDQHTHPESFRLLQPYNSQDRAEQQLSMKPTPDDQADAESPIGRKDDQSRIFLSYAREDEARAEKLYQQLSEAGFSPWMDRQDILPGERWEPTIERAIQAADFFVACLSEVAVRKRSYIRREFRGAVTRREEMLEHDIYLIPVRLEECEVPDELRAHKWLDLFKPNGWELLVRALHVGLKRRGKTLPVPVLQAQNTARVGSVEQERTNRIGMRFVLLPAGEFRMGASDEQPVHTVRISQPFYLGKYPVRQVEWEAVMGENPSHFRGADRPVEQVSWEDVQEFVRRLTEQETGVSYRLPSEAEWEYAARAGSSTAYCFGDNEEQLGEYGWYGENSGGETHPVGQRKANSWGLHDMHGNVWEWVEDWYGAYSVEPVTDPQGPSSGTFRVFRGGNWINEARSSRSACRLFGKSGNRGLNLGFRVLRTVTLGA